MDRDEQNKARPKFDLRAAAQRMLDRTSAGMRSTGERLAGWWSRAMAPDRRQRTLGVAGAGLAVLLLFGVMAVPGPSPAERQTQLAVTGEDLYESLMKQRPELRDDSRIETGAERAGSTNRLVLPEEIWQLLDADQRISLGTWLETLGGRWEIRVGTMTADGTAVRDTHAMITSTEWNRQLK